MVSHQMTQQYGERYVLRKADGEPVANQRCDLAEALAWEQSRRKVLTAIERGEILQFSADLLPLAERLLVNPHTNPEGETLVLDLDPMAANLPPRS